MLDLYIRFKVDFPRKLGQTVSGDDEAAKKSLQELEALLGKRGGGTSGFFSGWWNRSSGGNAQGGEAGGEGTGSVVVAERASERHKRALEAAEQRQASERERTEGF